MTIAFLDRGRVRTAAAARTQFGIQHIIVPKQHPTITNLPTKIY